MPLDKAAVEAAIRAAVVATSGLTDDQIILEGEEAPDEPYAVLNPWTVAQGNVLEEELLDEDAPGVITRRSWRKLTVSLHVYGTGAFQYADATHEGLCGTAVGEDLAAAGLAILDRGDVRNLTGQLEPLDQERASIEFGVGAVSVWTEDVGYIDSITIGGEFADGANEPLTFTDTIDSDP